MAMPALGRRSTEHLAALDRVREWTRERFKLDGEAAVLVAEIACTVPGCPPVETVIAFWDGGTRHHFKVFKPASEVKADDLPPAFMKGALAVSDDFQCGCC